MAWRATMTGHEEEAVIMCAGQRNEDSQLASELVEGRHTKDNQWSNNSGYHFMWTIFWHSKTWTNIFISFWSAQFPFVAVSHSWHWNITSFNNTHPVEYLHCHRHYHAAVITWILPFLLWNLLDGPRLERWSDPLLLLYPGPHPAIMKIAILTRTLTCLDSLTLMPKDIISSILNTLQVKALHIETNTFLTYEWCIFKTDYLEFKRKLGTPFAWLAVSVVSDLLVKSLSLSNDLTATSPMRHLWTQLGDNRTRCSGMVVNRTNTHTVESRYLARR